MHYLYEWGKLNDAWVFAVWALYKRLLENSHPGRNNDKLQVTDFSSFVSSAKKITDIERKSLIFWAQRLLSSSLVPVLVSSFRFSLY